MVASVFNDSSEISIFNINDTLIDFSDDFLFLYNKSKEIYYNTDGIFNPAIGPLIKYYGFLKDKGTDKIDTQYVKQLLCFTNLDSIKINVEQRKITKPKGYYLDFNAIATGYTVDKIAQNFDKLGIENYLIEIGGEVYAKGSHKNKKPWKVGIEKPPVSMYSPQNVLLKVAIKDKAIVTSGITRKYHSDNNKKINHIIDPQTGFPIPSNILSVSVIAPNCTDADAYATAFMIMGVDNTLNFIKNMPPYEVFFIIVNKDSFDIKYSDGFANYIISH
jgi:thiamine biosynthesis lipoprotein